jgi:hypothetical protein
MKAPSANIQAPEKLQASSSNSNAYRTLALGVWTLVFLWMLELGIWNF